MTTEQTGGERPPQAELDAPRVALALGITEDAAKRLFVALGSNDQDSRDLIQLLAYHGANLNFEMIKERERTLRLARRELDAEEVEAARGPRTKRTLEEQLAVPPPDVVIEDVLAAEVNLLGGPSEAGKSLLARDWALAVARGESWWKHEVPAARRVLWVASEGLHDLAERWQSQPGWEETAEHVLVLDEPVDLVRGNDADWLLKEYAEEKPGLVVFDVVYGMGLPDDNGTKDVVPLIGALKRISAEWEAATLAVGHPGHNGERRFRGSSAWRQLAATEWHLAGGTLSCEKSKLADKRRLTVPVQVAYPHLRQAEFGDVAAQVAERSRRIQADLREHPDDSQSARARRLHAGLGVSERTARRLVALELGVEDEGDAA